VGRQGFIMPSSFASLFRKTADCPTSQVLLACRRSLLTAKDEDYIESHLASCDFCSAELQLLTRYRSEAEEYSFAEMPAQLRRLAEDLLKRRTAPFKGFAELGESHQVSH
jgi:anti-sigma factor RsiW